MGLDETMAELYQEGWKPDEEAAEEIIKRLKDHKNYIPSSESVYREFLYVLLREYRKYVKEQSG